MGIIEKCIVWFLVYPFLGRGGGRVIKSAKRMCMCDYVKNRFEKGYKQMNVLNSCKHTAGASMSMFNDFIANFEHYRIFCYCAINASFKQILTHGLN